MPRSCSELPPAPLFDSNESIESVLERCPSKAFVTPALNKPVALRPLKRTKTSDVGGDGSVRDPPLLDLDGDADDEGGPRGLLSPRKLDMDQAVVLANPSLVPSDDELEEEEPGVQMTQAPPAVEDTEEGEITTPSSSSSTDVPVVLMRCESASLVGGDA